MWFAEAHKTNTDDTTVMTNYLEATLKGRWVTFIAPCIANGGRKYASTMACIRLKDTEDTSTYTAYRGIDHQGAPCARHPAVGQEDTPRLQKGAHREGRLLYVQANKIDNLHDTLVVYATNTQQTS